MVVDRHYEFHGRNLTNIWQRHCRRYPSGREIRGIYVSERSAMKNNRLRHGLLLGTKM